MDDKIKSNMLSSKHWLRLVFMLLFAGALQIASAVMLLVVALQFAFLLVTGSDNLNLKNFGYSLSGFIHQTLLFLTYNREEKPFPFSPWPSKE